MKQAIFAVALSLVAPALSADATWYAEDRNVTCTGHEADGSITCESGHIGNAPVVCIKPITKKRLLFLVSQSLTPVNSGSGITYQPSVDGSQTRLRSA